MKLSNQYLSFLGGEVSESLWYRTDMDKFNKWFANAENIRFTTMGSFSNRPGFKRLGPVLDYQKKPLVKLIPFVFNNEEVFEIEFVAGRFRVRKNGEVIIREDGSEVVYDSPIKIESLQQLKYAQSGDIIFIASGTSPVMELRRLKTDGTEWELVEFSGELPPLGETVFAKAGDLETKPTSETEGSLYEDVEIDFRNTYNLNSLYNYGAQGKGMLKIYPTDGDPFTLEIGSDNIGVRLDRLLSSIETQINGDQKCIEKNLTCDARGNSLVFRSFGLIEKVEIHLDVLESTTSLRMSLTKTIRSSSDNIIRELIYTLPEPTDGFRPGFAEDIWRRGQAVGLPYFYNETDEEVISAFNKENYSEITKNGNNTWSLRLYGDFVKYAGNATTQPWVYYYRKINNGVATITFSKQGLGAPTHTLLCPKDIRPLEDGEVFAIEHKIDGSALSVEITDPQSEKIYEHSGGVYLLGDGKWRFRTSGNWVGYIKIEYSKADENEWVFLRKISSDQKKDPGVYNDNVSGAIETDTMLKFRLKVYIKEIGKESGDGPLRFHFETDSFYVNAYYQVLALTYKDTSGLHKYLLKSLKNRIDNNKHSKKIRFSVFSDKNGYPETVGFYQNRLFFGKGYELWGSKLNDYWDFYEPMDLQKEDPINISILTYKVNTIKNILTTKSFFVFTTGGEFGIASQGAISQDDKFLKQFSSHGSNDCQPLIVGNLVVFVDSTGSTVRAFQYSFESDSYEANDITIFIEEKLKGKNIITTEYIKSTKECLFLDADGVIWVFKYMPEQNIMAWSHWKHGRYKITNLCVSPRGAYDDLYVVVDAPDGKFIEKLDDSVYSDSVESYSFENKVSEVQTSLFGGDIVNVDDGINNKYKATVGEFGAVKLRSPSDSVKIGLSYNSTATLLTPTISLQDGTYTTFRKQKLNKAHFIYKDSFGFKVGEENSEKMEIDFQSPIDSIESQVNLSSGKKSVLIPNTYDGTARLSFVQDEPYPMKIVNVLLESDYGGQ